MYITKISSNTTPLYCIKAEDGEIYCTEADLVALRGKINDILEANVQKPRIKSMGSIGGLMVQGMIEAYERKRR